MMLIEIYNQIHSIASTFFFFFSSLLGCQRTEIIRLRLTKSNKYDVTFEHIIFPSLKAVHILSRQIWSSTDFSWNSHCSNGLKTIPGRKHFIRNLVNKKFLHLIIDNYFCERDNFQYKRFDEEKMMKKYHLNLINSIRNAIDCFCLSNQLW